jgi:UrcA family protein
MDGAAGGSDRRSCRNRHDTCKHWCHFSCRQHFPKEKFQMSRTLAISTALLASALFALPATAQVRPVDQRVTVSTADLDVASDAGRAAFLARIDQAVTRACGTLHTRSTSELQANLACTRQARAQAQGQAQTVIADAESHRKVAMSK